MKRLIGPFHQLVSCQDLPLAGPVADSDLRVISNAGIIVNDDRIESLGSFEDMRQERFDKHETIEGAAVVVPGFVDSHTHICYAGSRAADYAFRVAGESYLQIAARGGGIMDTVRKTRDADYDELKRTLKQRAFDHLRHGITTCEVKSGYGLSLDDELRMLEIIRDVDQNFMGDLVSSCLAAHIKPPEFATPNDYIEHLMSHLFPFLGAGDLTSRIDIFVEDGAFDVELSRTYLLKAKSLGFDVVVHADQFSTGGAKLAAEVGAISADHLEVSTQEDFRYLAEAGVVATALPGASLGLGVEFTKARMALDEGCILAIASDWNPGSAPMGDLLMQASVLGAREKLTLAETLSAITFRAAHALSLSDRGRLQKNEFADFVIFPTEDYREIFYHQGAMKPRAVYKKGISVALI